MRSRLVTVAVVVTAVLIASATFVTAQSPAPSTGAPLFINLTTTRSTVWTWSSRSARTSSSVTTRWPCSGAGRTRAAHVIRGRRLPAVPAVALVGLGT